MERIATLVLKNCEFKALGDCFGCETGALSILEKGIILKAAFGDFDSVTHDQRKRIELEAKAFKVYPSHKDMSDSELAIKEILKEGYTKIFIYGGLGGRSDHQHVNTLLAYQYPQVEFRDENQCLYGCTLGHHVIEKENYDLFSIFTFNEAVISMRQCVYPLDHKQLSACDTFSLSNAWVKDQVDLEVHEGSVICIKTKNI